MKPELDFQGDWEMISVDVKGKYAVTLKKRRDWRSIDKQSYYLKISPRNYDSRFNFIGVVHKVNGIKLLQITNFTHYHGDVFRLANRPTVSLWQIAYDKDNIIIWAPSFPRKSIATLKTMRDSDDKLLFIDSTENLQAYLNNWTKNYSEIKDSIDKILPIILTRVGTEFRMPEEMQDLVPRVYKAYMESDGN